MVMMRVMPAALPSSPMALRLVLISAICSGVPLTRMALVRWIRLQIERAALRLGEQCLQRLHGLRGLDTASGINSSFAGVPLRSSSLRGRLQFRDLFGECP